MVIEPLRSENEMNNWPRTGLSGFECLSKYCVKSEVSRMIPREMWKSKSHKQCDNFIRKSGLIWNKFEACNKHKKQWYKSISNIRKSEAYTFILICEVSQAKNQWYTRYNYMSNDTRGIIICEIQLCFSNFYLRFVQFLSTKLIVTKYWLCLIKF